jgi:hypothetical protein
MSDNGQSYSVLFKNMSTQSGNACIYQRNPDYGWDIMSLAWLVKSAPPGSNVRFEWRNDYSFVWGETGRLAPGVRFVAGQSWNADPNSNAITFTMLGGGYSFQNQMSQPPAGSFFITESPDVPMNQSAAVGIGMSGAGTFVQQARPNMRVTFNAQQEYWIAFGNFNQGEVLDTQAINNPVRIAFPAGVYSMTATLNADNSWTVKPA